MKFLIKTCLFVSGFFIAFSANAFEVAVEFSAEAVQNTPGGPAMNAKMFVSKKAVRTESTMNGTTIVEIVYSEDKRRVLLNQFSKTYIEQKAPNNNAIKKHKVNGSPCNGSINTTCKKLGKEKVEGREADKWEMTVQQNGRAVKSLHWLDKKYRMPLRAQYPDGTVSTLTLLSKEKINGRNTEKWKFLVTRPDGRSIESQQWYDPKLKMVIREMLPGGYVRELRNIKVARQSKKLFNIPSEYKKEVMPGMNTQRMMMPGRPR